MGLQRARLPLRLQPHPLRVGPHGRRPGFFGDVVEAGFHQRAVRLVAGGRVDAAAIDSQVLAVELRDHPRLAAGLRAAVWAIAALTAASGLVVAVRMYETHPAPVRP